MASLFHPVPVLCHLFVLYFYLAYFSFFSFFFRSRDYIVLKVSVVEYESLDDGSGSVLLFVSLPTVASGLGFSG